MTRTLIMPLARGCLVLSMVWLASLAEDISPTWAQDSLVVSTKLQAEQVLPPELRNGPHFRVAAEVVNDGFVNYYDVESGFGRFRAVSTPALAKLIREIGAIAAMAKIEAGEAFGESLAETAKKTGKGIKRLFTDPLGAVEGAAEGMGRLFERADEGITGPGPGQAEDSRAEQIIGFSKAKREIGAKFKVDVYSANPVLQKHLDRLAWADYAGGLTLGAATMVVPGAPGVFVSVSGGARLLEDVIRTTPPAELRIQNRARLKAAGISPELTDLFIGNQVYSPREQTVVAVAVEAMKGVKNRNVLIQTMLRAHNRDLAYVLTNMALMYAIYHEKVAPLTELKTLARAFYARTNKGGVVLALPADYMPWSRRVQEGADLIASQNKGAELELYITGKLAPQTEKELAKRGWKLTTEVQASAMNLDDSDGKAGGGR